MTIRVDAALIFAALLTATQASAHSPCTVLAKTAGGGTQFVLTDLDEEFPEFQAKADKGVTVTLEHLIQLKVATELTNFRFGCKVTFDLWNKRYSVVPTGFSAVKDAEFLAAIKSLPLTCRTALLPVGVGTLNGELEVLSSLDPVSEEQAAKTRSWLAERGIGSASQALLGRAVAALIDLKEDKAVRRLCRIKLEP